MNEGVFIGGGGVPCSEKVENELKLLSRIVNECSGIIIQWMVQAYVWGIAHWLKNWSMSAHGGPTSVCLHLVYVLCSSLHYCIKVESPNIIP